MIRKGDRVKFLNEATVGTVARIEGSMAYVSVEDGFEIPALLTDLVATSAEDERVAMRRMGVGDGTPVGTKGPRPRETKAKPPRLAPQYGRIALAPDADEDEEDDDNLPDLVAIRQNYLKRQTVAAAAEAAEQVRAAAAPSPVDLTAYEVKLCFVPQDAERPEESAQLECHLVNDSSYRLFYTVAQWGPGRAATLVASGLLEEDSKALLHTLRREELSRPRRWQIGLLLFKPTGYAPAPAEDFVLDLSPMKFVRRGSYVENDYFDEPAVVFTLASDREQVYAEREAARALEENLAQNLPGARKDAPKDHPAPAKGSAEPEIVDLHAEQILDSTEGLSNGEILKAQLARMEFVLDGAVSAGRPQKLVFIHGVGSGKLKYEMQKVLAAKYPRLRYQDASFKEYGYGAILVTVR